MSPDENLDAAAQALGDKPWWQSKIILVNLLALALAALEANITSLQGHIPGGLLAWLTVVLPMVNIVLRFVTRSGVRL
jgi:hypothetical protein